MEQYIQSIKARVVERMDMAKDTSDEEILQMIDEEILSEEEPRCLSVWEKIRIQKDVFNGLRRLDVLQELVENRKITEIMINGPDNIFIEEAGRIRQWDKQFESEEKLQDVVQQIVSKANRVVNE